MSVRGHVGDFQKHRASEVHALQKLKVDVHMERQLTLLLKFLLLRSFLGVALCLDTLRKELLHLSGGRNLLQSVGRFPHHAATESTKTELDHRSVVQNLGLDVGLGCVLLQVGHEDQFAGFVEPVMEGEVVNVAEEGASTDTVDDFHVVQAGAEVGDEFGRLFKNLVQSGVKDADLGFDLLDNVIRFVIETLDPTHLSEVSIFLSIQFLKVFLGADDDGVKGRLVFQAVDVLDGVWVNVLQRFGELIVDPVNEGSQVTRNLNGVAVICFLNIEEEVSIRVIASCIIIRTISSAASSASSVWTSAIVKCSFSSRSAYSSLISARVLEKATYKQRFAI